MITLLRPYCSLADVQRECINSDAAQDDWYRECINHASRMVEEICGRDFWFHDHSGGQGTPVYQVPRGDVLKDKIYLPFPIITLTGLWAFSNRAAGPTDADLWAADAYDWENSHLGRAVISAETGVFGDYPFKGGVTLSGTFGFVLAQASALTTPPPSLPSSVRRATWLIAAAISGNRSVEEIGLDGQKVQLLEKSVPKEALTLLAPFKSPADTAF